MEIKKCDHCGKEFDGSHDFLEVNIKNLGLWLNYNNYHHESPKPKHFCDDKCISEYYRNKKEAIKSILNQAQ